MFFWMGQVAPRLWFSSAPGCVHRAARGPAACSRSASALGAARDTVFTTAIPKVVSL